MKTVELSKSRKYLKEDNESEKTLISRISRSYTEA
jgi:hypothetical protein